MHALPDVENIEAFDAWRAEPSQCLPAALDIARSHGLSYADAQLFSIGTNLVVALTRALRKIDAKEGCGRQQLVAAPRCLRINTEDFC
jgi:hypothetical protein